MCRDNRAKSASLGEFLEVVRRFKDDVFFTAAAELENVVVVEQQQRNRNGRLLFDDGRIH